MTYQFIKEQVLKLLNQYTMAGSPVPVLYNNQQDYIARIPSLTNDAMMEIATTVRKIPALLDLASLPQEDLGREIRYEMPEDFFQFKSGDTALTEDGRMLHTNLFMLHGQRYLVLPKKGDYSLVYYRYPALLPDDPDDGAELDGDPETHFAIPFYVAALLAAHDDPYLCTLLMNKFTDKLQKMGPAVTAEAHTVTDAYGFSAGGDCL